jgi:hypothetical protein
LGADGHFPSVTVVSWQIALSCGKMLVDVLLGITMANIGNFPRNSALPFENCHGPRMATLVRFFLR